MRDNLYDEADPRNWWDPQKVGRRVDRERALNSKNCDRGRSRHRLTFAFNLKVCDHCRSRRQESRPHENVDHHPEKQEGRRREGGEQQSAREGGEACQPGSKNYGKKSLEVID